MNFIIKTPTYDKNSFDFTNEAYLFIKSLPNYEQTPLVSLTNLAEKINIKNILLKDESNRLGLNAFKILGAMNAIFSVLKKYYELDNEQISFEDLITFLKDKPPLTFITATDGNHGKAVAKASRLFGQKAIVYLPKGAAKARLDAIIEEGAKAEILDINYDQAVAFANKQAMENGYILVQDTSLENYIDIPA